MISTSAAMRGLAIAATALTLASCAELQIYSDPGLTTRAGIPFYVSKPYLLVSRTGAKDKPVEIQIIYMPDLAHPFYARIMPGLGSSETSLAFTNSILTTVGQKSDTQLDELMTAYGGLQTALAAAGKTERETDLLGDESAPDYAAIAVRLVSIASQIEVAAREAQRANILTEGELEVLTAAATVARTSASALSGPTAESQLQITVASLKNAAKAWDEVLQAASTATDGSEPITRRNLSALRVQFGEAIAALSPAPTALPAFTLYEIVMDPTGTRLVEVK